MLVACRVVVVAEFVSCMQSGSAEFVYIMRASVDILHCREQPRGRAVDILHCKFAFR